MRFRRPVAPEPAVQGVPWGHARRVSGAVPRPGQFPQREGIGRSVGYPPLPFRSPVTRGTIPTAAEVTRPGDAALTGEPSPAGAAYPIGGARGCNRREPACGTLHG